MISDKEKVWNFITRNIISLSTVVAGVAVLVLRLADQISPDKVPLMTLVLVALLLTIQTSGLEGFFRLSQKSCSNEGLA